MATLTKQELLIAEQNIIDSEQYDPVKLLTHREQVNHELCSTMNEYVSVAGTVESPILDETNMLYKVDGIDEDSLYNVLMLHKQARGITDSVKEESGDRADATDTQHFRKIVDEIDGKETEFHQSANMYNYVPVRNVDVKECFFNVKEELKVKPHQLVNKILMNLSVLWKDYARYQKRMHETFGMEYVSAERSMKAIFNKIKGLEKTLSKLESFNEQEYFNQNIKPQIDNLLDRFVTWQQSELAKGNDPTITWKDALAKSGFKRYSLYI